VLLLEALWLTGADYVQAAMAEAPPDEYAVAVAVWEAYIEEHIEGKTTSKPKKYWKGQWARASCGSVSGSVSAGSLEESSATNSDASESSSASGGPSITTPPLRQAAAPLLQEAAAPLLHEVAAPLPQEAKVPLFQEAAAPVLQAASNIKRRPARRRRSQPDSGTSDDCTRKRGRASDSSSSGTALSGVSRTTTRKQQSSSLAPTRRDNAITHGLRMLAARGHADFAESLLLPFCPVQDHASLHRAISHMESSVPGDFDKHLLSYIESLCSLQGGGGSPDTT